MEPPKEDEIPDMKEIIKKREEKWNGFFEKYKDFDFVEQNDSLSDYSEQEMTDDDSFEVVSESDDQNNDYEAIEVDDSVAIEDKESDDGCIEVSEDDERASMFSQVFQQIVKQKIEVFEKNSRQNSIQKIKTKDGMTKHVRESTICKERRSIMASEMPMPTTPNMYINIPNLQENNCMALVKPHSSAIQPHGSNIAVDENIEVLKSGKMKITKTITTTTTTTTTTVQEFQQDENVTPQKAKPPRSAKKKRTANEATDSEFDVYGTNYDDDDLQTPHQRKGHFNVSATSLSTTKINESRLAIELTPTTANGRERKLVPKQIRSVLSETIQNGEMDENDFCGVTNREIQPSKGSRLSLVFTPQRNKAITAGDSFVDPLAMQKENPRAIYINARDDVGKFADKE
ncbi:uncharacterized protein LOC116346642 [Contarinia nasturtii]|uniref:uncharacterized protein LOC116346642 n=1 Tax=Contarinia nasturtii TaxID=265458 RepID=UPI0012D3C787|nr:uncharacterized protein LOC116346642 [Contarinia nasturtii]